MILDLAETLTQILTFITADEVVYTRYGKIIPDMQGLDGPELDPDPYSKH